jgi:2-oxoglutarate ferredoxin oxidoreductase subunit alpha
VTKQVQQLDRVIIRFAGDSGDGMQLTGDRFTSETAAFGNDLSTLPNFPAEIRGPRRHAARGSRRSSCTSPTTTS